MRYLKVLKDTISRLKAELKTRINQATAQSQFNINLQEWLAEKDAQLKQVTKDRDSLKARNDKVIRLIDIAQKANDAQSEQEVATSASFQEAMALTMLEQSQEQVAKLQEALQEERERGDKFLADHQATLAEMEQETVELANKENELLKLRRDLDEYRRELDKANNYIVKLGNLLGANGEDTPEIRIAELKAQLEQWQALGVIAIHVEPGEHGEGEEVPVTPEFIKSSLTYLQGEWDDAERRISKMETQLEGLRDIFRHTHVKNGKDDRCKQCGLDLRNEIHANPRSIQPNLKETR